jgi:hypothetical protein
MVADPINSPLILTLNSFIFMFEILYNDFNVYKTTRYCHMSGNSPPYL